MDMSNEKKPVVKKLLPEGWRKFVINSAEAKISKQGNEMFVVNIGDVKTGYTEDIYLVATQGKRWLLKELLAACGITRGSDDKYSWDIPDILTKEIAGLVEHEPNEYINRNGETVKTTIHRINSFDLVNNKIGWDET